MKKLFSLKYLSQIPKSFSPSPSPSPSHSHSHSHCFRPFHSISNPISSPVRQWRSPKIYGFLSNPVLAKHFVSTAHFKGSIKNFVVPKVVFIRTQFPKAKPSPWSSSQRRSWSSWSQESTDGVILGLILANTGVFMLWRILNPSFMYKNFTISVDNFKSGRVHTLITSAFSHIDMGHIVSNMIGLYFFGNSIGRVFGPEYLLKLYFAGAAVGSVFYLVHHAYFANMFKKQGTFSRDSSKVPGLGASGAVNAILLLDIFLFPKKTILFDFFIPVPAILLGIFLVGKDVLRMVEGDPQISGSAHLGGAAVAAVAWLRLKRGIRF